MDFRGGGGSGGREENQLCSSGRGSKPLSKKTGAAQCLASFKLKLVTDAVMVSCVNAIDRQADRLRSLNARTINPAAVSPATLLNS